MHGRALLRDALRCRPPHRSPALRHDVDGIGEKRHRLGGAVTQPAPMSHVDGGGEGHLRAIGVLVCMLRGALDRRLAGALADHGISGHAPRPLSIEAVAPSTQQDFAWTAGTSGHPSPS
jgi:hypothetical protein